MFSLAIITKTGMIEHSPATGQTSHSEHWARSKYNLTSYTGGVPGSNIYTFFYSSGAWQKLNV